MLHLGQLWNFPQDIKNKSTIYLCIMVTVVQLLLKGNCITKETTYNNASL